MNENQRLDLHVHSLFSDGVLLPSEILRRAAAKGYGAVAITDHADASNLDANERVSGSSFHGFEALPLR